ncbi:MAG: NERD domain-containing protein [Muribaculaceae bacterium]|nr:NERD domain-containing protein [Muribaculaceae bacterium]
MLEFWSNWKIAAAFLAGIVTVALPLLIAARWRRGRAARKGRQGERKVSRELSRLRKRDFIILNDVMLPAPGGRTSQIDHIVVSTRGIFVIETKSHAGRISGHENGQYWQQHLSSQSRSFFNPILQNRSHIRALRRLLPKVDGQFFFSAIIFTDAWRLDIKADDIVVERTLLPDKHIRRTLIPQERRKRRWWNPGREVRLDSHVFVSLLSGLNDELRRRPKVIGRDSLRQLAEAIRTANISDRTARREHLGLVAAASRAASERMERGVCPRCGAPLAIRRGERGEFAACTRFPACRFTCSIDRLRH